MCGTVFVSAATICSVTPVWMFSAGCSAGRLSAETEIAKINVKMSVMQGIMSFFMGSSFHNEKVQSLCYSLSIAEQIRHVNNFILNYFNNVLYKLSFLW